MLGPDCRNREKARFLPSEMLRRKLNIRWNSYISNEVVLERSDDEDLTKQLEEEDVDTWDMLSEWTRREYNHKHGHECQQGRGNEDDLDQPLEGQCNEICKLVTSPGLTCLKTRGAGLDGELFSLPCVPDGTGRE